MGRPGLTQHRKFRRLERALGSPLIARGALEMLWDSAYENGDEYLGSAADVEAAARWDGEAGALLTALLEAGGDGNAGFIEEIPDRSGHYQIHNLFENAPEYVQKRMLRELARKERGVTISDLRREAGKRGRAVTVGQTSGQLLANGGQLPANGGQLLANGDTPAPAPAPLKVKISSSEQERSDEELFPSTPTEEKELSEQDGEASPTPKPKKKKKSPEEPSERGKKLAALLRDEILRNKPDSSISRNWESTWGLEADHMIRIDKRDPEVIASLIRWCQRDKFECANVRSMEKLRERFDSLQIKSGIASIPTRPKPVPITTPAVVLKANPATDALLKKKSMEHLEKVSGGAK